MCIGERAINGPVVPHHFSLQTDEGLLQKTQDSCDDGTKNHWEDKVVMIEGAGLPIISLINPHSYTATSEASSSLTKCLLKFNQEYHEKCQTQRNAAKAYTTAGKQTETPPPSLLTCKTMLKQI